MADHTRSSALNRQRERDDTVQGMFIAAADGTSYGWKNTHNPREVERFLNTSLTAFRRNPPQKVMISEEAWRSAFATTPHPSTSVIRVFSRIRPLPQGADPSNRGVGRDHLWVLASEVREIVSSAGDSGKSIPLPGSLVARLTRFHLVDNVRGEPDMWAADDVKKADFAARRIRRTDTLHTFAFSGVYDLKTANEKRGLKGVLRGQFAIDASANRIIWFRADGAGQAWGRSRYTPRPPRGRFPLAIGMIEANDPIAKVVPPQAISSGEAYPALAIDLKEYTWPERISRR